MRVLTAEPMPSEVEGLIERRRLAGADRHDEIWDGVLHMGPDPSRAHLSVQQQLAELLGPLARAAGLDPGISGFNLGEYEPVERSALVELGAGELAQRLDWPALEP